MADVIDTVEVLGAEVDILRAVIEHVVDGFEHGSG